MIKIFEFRVKFENKIIIMAGMVVGGLFNAFAFAGAGFLFSKLNHSDYEAEMHRHNLAQERLRQAQENFFEVQTKLREKMQRLRERQHHADEDFEQTNKSLEMYENILKDMQKPVLKDYYKPSAEMQHYQNLSGGVIAIAIGGLLYYLL